PEYDAPLQTGIMVECAPQRKDLAPQGAGGACGLSLQRQVASAAALCMGPDHLLTLGTAAKLVLANLLDTGAQRHRHFSLTEAGRRQPRDGPEPLVCGIAADVKTGNLAVGPHLRVHGIEHHKRQGAEYENWQPRRQGGRQHIVVPQMRAAEQGSEEDAA